MMLTSMHNDRRTHTRWWMEVSWAIAFTAAMAATAWGQPAADGETPANGKEAIDLSIGRSAMIQPPWPVARVSVAEPKIADVQAVTPTTIIVLGKTAGTTDVMLWNEEGEALHREVHVRMDLDGLREDLQQFFPYSKLNVRQSQGIVAVSGEFRRAEDAPRLKAYMETAGLKYADLTTVAGGHQVLIQVRVAEASRTALRSLGVNAFYGNDSFFGGSTVGGNQSGLNVGLPDNTLAAQRLPFQFNTDTAVSSAVTLFTGFPDIDLQFFIEALVDNQYMRILAEPSLVALSGEEASFLAGGEFPIPIVQGTTTGGGTSISIEFKEFGVLRLAFRPTVLGDGTIRLKVAPEVSSLSEVGAVQLQGFSIPSLTTRRAETTLQLQSGQSFALAGLLNQEIRARGEKVPGLGEVPVLGALFRSVRYRRADTELLVLATVTLVEPLSSVEGRPVPGDLHGAPDDWELFAAGRIEGRTPARLSPAHADWLRRTGLDRLKGPGAWEPQIEREPHVPAAPMTPPSDTEAPPADAAPPADEAEAPQP